MLKTLFYTLLFSLTATSLSAFDEPPATIRVLVQDQVVNPVVEVTGNHRILNPQNGKYISDRVFDHRHVVHTTNNGICWGNDFPGLHQLGLMPSKKGVTVVVNGTQYSGAVYLYQIGNRVSVVNEVPIDHYCRIVLANQFPGERDPEVMAAVAIAARTTACFHAVKRHDSPWHVRADEVGYTGNEAVHRAPAAVAAVNATRGIYLDSTEGPFQAMWTEDCAGKTASFSSIFRTQAPGVSVPSTYAEHHRELSGWSVSVPAQWLAEATELETVADIDLFTDRNSKKVYAVRISDGVQAVNLDFCRLQEIVGEKRLRGTEFTAALEKGNVVFTGHGQGLGVGICLYSADEMAHRGKNAADILTTFYPDAHLKVIKNKPFAKKA